MSPVSSNRDGKPFDLFGPGLNLATPHGYRGQLQLNRRAKQRPLSEQEKRCQELVLSLGGDHAIFIAKEVPQFCGVYPRPEGLEFFTEQRDPGGVREVTGISITSPERPEVDTKV